MATSASWRLIPPWTWSSAGSPSRARVLVELDAPELEPPVDRPLGAAPERPPGGGARQPGAERVDREVGLPVRVDVGDERGSRTAVELGGERGGEREDVCDDDVGAQLAHERERVDGRVHDRLVEVKRLGPAGKDLVLRRGSEVEPLGLDVLLPAPPGLKRHVVSAGGERAPEGDHREGVPGVAEGAEQHPPGMWGARSGSSACHGRGVRRRARRAAAAARGAPAR